MHKPVAFCCLVVLFFLCLLPYTLFSQQFGGHPPSQKWRQINTDTARIIFSAGQDSQAQRISSIVHYLASQKPFSLGNDLHKINIVLQHQTTVANGYVGLGPFRSEFYLMPNLNNFELGSIAWHEQLAVHEYRHVQQFNNFRNGISKALYYLFGEEGLALAINASVPDWFYEGDAVYNETTLTNQGRGRLPLFLNGYNSLWLSQKNYSWMKLRNGSYKDYVPNHYQLGYMLVSYGREKYGPDFWTKVTRDASAFKGLFYPLQKAIKRHAGIDYKTFRQQAFEFSQLLYKSGGIKKEKSNSIGADERIATQGTMPQGTGAGITNLTRTNYRYVTNYFFPYQLSADSLLYLKSSYRHIPAFYIKDAAGKHRLRAKDIALDEQYSYRNGNIVYAAYEPDIRWGWKNYSEIRLLDIKTGVQKTITHKTKYFTPDISQDGTKIAAVQMTTDGRSELHILNAGDGAVMKIIKSTEIGVYTDPKFMDDNTVVSAVRLDDGRMCFALINVETGRTERLTPPSYNIIGYPAADKGFIYFTASYSGNDEIYALRLKDRKIFQFSNTDLGNYYVNASDSSLVWAGFTADGYQLRRLNINNKLLAEINPMTIQETAARYFFNSMTSTGDILLSKVPPRRFAVSRYKKSTGLFNFHSYRPYYEDPVFSFSLYGENILNTLQTELYYLYNENENTHAAGFNAVYGGLFPYISAGTEFTFNRAVPFGTNGRREFNQLDSRIGFSIPLNLTSGRLYNFFTISTNYVLRNEFNVGIYKNLPENNFTYLHHYINWSQQTQTARQHIYPRFGYSLAVNHRYAVTKINGYQFLSSAALYLPGVHSTHSIVLTGSFQQRDTLRALFANRFAFSRGYIEAYFSRMWRGSANYHFPIVYPDFGFANIVYLHRLRGNAFYDYTRVFSNNKLLHRDLRTAGGELYFDTQWWNQYPLTFGIRYSRLLDNNLTGPLNKNQWEIILPVSILPR